MGKKIDLLFMNTKMSLLKTLIFMLSILTFSFIFSCRQRATTKYMPPPGNNSFSNQQSDKYMPISIYKGDSTFIDSSSKITTKYMPRPKIK